MLTFLSAKYVVLVMVAAFLWSGAALLITKALEISELKYGPSKEQQRSRHIHYIQFKPLTYLVGVFEAGATIMLINFYAGQLHGEQLVTRILILIGGWFAIKTISHTSDVRDESLLHGTPKHYKFVLGTLISIGGGVLLGVLIGKSLIY